MYKTTLLVLPQLRPLHNLIVPQTLCVVLVEGDALASTVRGPAFGEAAFEVGPGFVVCFLSEVALHLVKTN